MKIYLESIKIARKEGDISFNKLREKLIENGYDENIISSNHFIYWFFSNFFIEGLNPSMANDMNEVDHFIKAIRDDIHVDKKCHLKPETNMFYKQAILNKRIKTLTTITVLLTFCGLIVGLISILN